MSERLIWNMFIVGGCGVAVLGLGKSAAWFLLALMLMA